MLTQSQSHWAEKTDAGKSLRGSGLKKYKPGECRNHDTILLDLLQISSFLVYKVVVI